MNEFTALIPDFIEEARDHLTAMEAALVHIESAIQEQRIPESDLLERLFREAHALYGGAELVGIEPLEMVAAALADLFNFLRNGDIAPDAEIVSLAFQAIDSIRSATENPSGTMKEAVSAAALIRKTIEERLPERVRRAVATTVSTGIPFSDIKFAVSTYTLERKTRRGHFYLLSINPERYTAATGQTLIHLSETLAALGEVLDTVSRTTPDNTSVVYFLYHTMLAPEALRLSFPDLPPEAITLIPREQLDALVSPVSTDDTKTVSRRGTTTERRSGKTTQTASTEPSENVLVPTREKRSSPEVSHTQESSIMPEAEWEHCTDFVTFFIDRELYAVPIFLVHDIKEMLPCSRLPNQPPSVLGVINLRGSVVPLFDLRRLIGLPPRPFDRKTVIIILEIGGKMNGLVVDTVSDVATIEPHAKQAPPLLGRNIAADYVRFIGTDRKSGEFLIVLDIEKVLAPLLADS